MANISVHAHIAAGSVVEPGAVIGDHCIIGPFCFIGKDVVLSERVIVHNHVSIVGRTRIGTGTEIFPFAALGGKPLDKKYKGEDSELIIGCHNQIREQVSMHPGTTGGGLITQVGDHGLFMVGAHVSHDCKVGHGVIMVNNSTLGGHVTLDDYAILGGHSAVHQFVRIGKNAMVGGMSGVNDDVPPFALVHGEHARMKGLNLLGLKRNKMEPSDIKELQKLLYQLFARDQQDGTPLHDKLALLADATKGNLKNKNRLIAEMLDFLHHRSHRAITAADF